MKNIKLNTFFSCMLFSLALGAQTIDPAVQPPKGSLSSGTIESQYRYILTISKNLDDFEVVRRVNLDKFKANVLDSLTAVKKQLSSADGELNTQKTQIDSLRNGIQTARNELQAALESKDSFAVLGMPIQKGAYSAVMWGLVLILAIALIFFIYRFRQSHVVTVDTRKALEEVQHDFDQHRKKAMEREQKLNRQLVDEMNKRQG